MDDLKQFYRNKLGARIKALEENRKAFSEGSPEADSALRHIAHSLRGSGSSFGFPLISEKAAELEDAADNDIPEKTEKLISALREAATGAESREASILIVDDDPAVYEFLQQELSGPNRKIYTATTGSEAEQILANEEVSLVILDLVLPDADGRDILTRLRKDPSTLLTPVMVLSAKASPDFKTECFALGADDYYEKPFDPSILVSAVSARLRRTSDVIRESRKDTLTGLPNRASFHESFASVRALCERQGHSLCLGILDIDFFKSVNDTFGHTTGDTVLHRLASLMSGSLRGSDVIARWGGEEFVVLLPDTPLDGAVSALDNVLRRAHDEEFHAKDGQVFHVTLSAGVANVRKDVTIEDAVSLADRFLYQAKAGGRNRVISEEQGIETKKRTALLAEDDDLAAHLIMNSLAEEGFDFIHFTDGAEALAKAPEAGVSLVILDVEMPGANGFDVLQELRKRPHYSRTPIVMLTGMGKEQDILTGFERGCDDYIAKPFSAPELLARVRRLLKRR
ncbi:response regulator [Verrucomicrobiota bacterium]